MVICYGSKRKQEIEKIFNVKQNRYMIKCYTEFERCHCESSEKEEVVWTDVVGECIEGEV